jgi:hypothetical protein
MTGEKPLLGENRKKTVAMGYTKSH